MNWRIQALLFAARLVVVILLEVWFLLSLTPHIPYSQSQKLVQAGQVAALTIGTTAIQGTLLDTATERCGLVFAFHI